MLVDEYQDTNHLQYLLTSLLAGGRQNLCVVGDDDQSIYRFRGANIENILNFEQQYPNARVIRLEQNYRSTQNILDAANAVIRNNQGRKGKTLWTDNGSGELVTVKTTFYESDEANYVVGDILMGVHRGRAFRDTAVLYRMNAQSNALEYALKRNGIPYKIVGGMKFFDRAEVKDMLAYLCVLNNPLDDLRLRRIINTPARGIGATTLDRVALLAEGQGSSLYEIIRNADLFPELKAASSKLLKFADLIDDLRRAGAQLALPEFYDAVCDRTGYVRALEEKNDMESRGRMENVQELKSNILGFLEQDPEDATLSGFLNEIALYTDLDSMEAGDDCVTMMTVHSAKGLEFPVVYVVGMEEGAGGGAAALLCGHDPGKGEADADQQPPADAVRPDHAEPPLPVPGGDPGGADALGEQAGTPLRRHGTRSHLRRRPVGGRRRPRRVRRRIRGRSGPGEHRQLYRRRLPAERLGPQLPGCAGSGRKDGGCTDGAAGPGGPDGAAPGGCGGTHRLWKGHGSVPEAHGGRRAGRGSL